MHVFPVQFNKSRLNEIIKNNNRGTFHYLASPEVFEVCFKVKDICHIKSEYLVTNHDKILSLSESVFKGDKRNN